MSKLIKHIILVLSWLAISVACQDSTLYISYQPVPTDGWHSHDTLTFDLPAQEVTTTCGMSAMVRAINDYGYEYLALRVEHITDGKVIHADTIKLHLFNNKEDAKFNDKDSYKFNNTEESKSVSFLYINKDYQLPAITLPAGTTNSIRVTHIMRQDPISGITDIGIECQRLTRPPL